MEQIISKYNTKFDNFSFHHTTTANGGKNLIEPELHSQFEILYLLNGEIKYTIEGEEYRVSKGDVIFVQPNEIHSIEIVGKEDYERVVVMFDLDKISEILSAGDFSLDSAEFCNSKSFRVIPREILLSSNIKKIMQEIASCQEEKMLGLFVLTKILNLILELEKIFCNKEIYVISSTDKVVEMAIKYINQNIEKKLSLEQISKALFVSKSSLCHKFAKKMHISINRYVAIKKIYVAGKLIKNGMGVIEASRRVGYEQYTTFYHNYKKIIGTYPSEKPNN